MKKLFLFLIFGIFLINCIYAEDNNLGKFNQGTCVSLYQYCDDCTFVNVIFILYILAGNIIILNLLSEWNGNKTMVYNHTTISNAYCDARILANTSQFLSTYNSTYAGLINNVSYLSTYNSTYDKWAYNMTTATLTYLDNSTIARTGITNTFSENNIFQKNITTEGINFEADTTNHLINDNATCVIIKGDTATLNIC